MTEEGEGHLQTSIFVNFLHASWYPPCTHSAVSQINIDSVGYSFHKSTAMEKTEIVSCWFSKTISTTCAVLTCSSSTGMKWAIIMDAVPLLNSLHPFPTWCSLSTPSPNTSINWQWDAMVKMFCLYKLSQHKVFCKTEFQLTLQLHVNLSLK